MLTLVRKPLIGSVALNVLKYGTGGINVDGCRISAGQDYTEAGSGLRWTASAMAYMGSHQTRPWVQRAMLEGRPVKDSKPHENGRWPANLILQHLPGCKCLGTKEVESHAFWGPAGKSTQKGVFHKSEWQPKGVLERTQTQETVADWDCQPGCPVDSLNCSVGVVKSGTVKPGYMRNNDSQPSRGGFEGGLGIRKHPLMGFGDEGYASRFFKQVQLEGAMITLPQDLIDYLTTMISPPGETTPYIKSVEDLDAWTPTIPNDSLPGVIVRGTPTETQVAELMRCLKPGAHIVLAAPDEQPTGHTGACRLEDGGFEIRDSILLVTEPGRFHYVPKVSRSEREAGCAQLPAKAGFEAVDREEGTAGVDNPRAGAGRTAESVHNFHPTVKPIELMERLLATVPVDNGSVVDPFMGSGSTLAACLKTGHDAIGIEREEEYIRIADARVRFWERGELRRHETVIESEVPVQEGKEEEMDPFDLLMRGRG